MKKKTQSRAKKVEPEKTPRQVLGITANIKNTMIAIALLFGFLGGFFQLYNWIDTTYARTARVKYVEIRQDFKDASDFLNILYARFWTLDNMFALSPDPSKIDPELRKEWNDLKSNKLKLQEEKVKTLQQQLLNK
jgi:hypothetical protein